ncbi:MAG: hypothetical protein CVV44_19355 [Spirochaetae bacterium HGW-Spirochaetae-1]|jgi:DNA-directed RNA polymerase subunit N (RpoN/RPB10)|nr:MAG: hypothetical protein CVV44_19355 [Spirochaetae bacterium HGW-Spirochaetae-1]
MGDEQEKLKALKCHDCGGDIVKSYRVEGDDEDEEQIPIARCLSCGREYDQHTQEYYAYFADSFITDKDKSVFKLGLKGTLNGVEYEIIGRLRYQDEDEYELDTWDEWLAITAEGAYHYFVEEDGDVHSYEEYIPETIDLESSGSSIEFEGKKISKSEAYIGRIVYAEGELPWSPEIGEAVTLYDFKKDGCNYTIEQSDEEVSITKGERIPYKQIIDAFGGDQYKEMYDATIKKRKEFTWKSRVYLAVMLVSLVMALYKCSSGSAIENIMAMTKVISTNVYMQDEGGANYFSQVLYGPFEIPEPDRLYEFSVSIDEAVQPLSQEWESFRLMLIQEDRLNQVTDNMTDFNELKEMLTEIDAQKEPVESYVVNGDFWDEEGYDSDGRWHENDLSASSSFVLDEAGRYFAYLELYSKNARNVDSVKIALSSAGSVRYFIILFVIFFILFMLNRSKAATYNALPFEVGSD